jgi:hypothetical protein
MGEGSEELALGDRCLGQEGVCPAGQGLQSVVPRRQHRGGDEDVADIAGGRRVGQVVEQLVSELRMRGAKLRHESWHSVASQPIRHSAGVSGGRKSRMEVLPLSGDRCVISTERLGQLLRGEAAGAQSLAEDPVARAATLARVGEIDPGAGSADPVPRLGETDERTTLFALSTGTRVFTHCRVAACADRAHRPVGVNRTVTETTCAWTRRAGITPLAERLSRHLARAGPESAAGGAGDRRCVIAAGTQIGRVVTAAPDDLADFSAAAAAALGLSIAAPADRTVRRDRLDWSLISAPDAGALGAWVAPLTADTAVGHAEGRAAYSPALPACGGNVLAVAGAAERTVGAPGVDLHLSAAA